MSDKDAKRCIYYVVDKTYNAIVETTTDSDSAKSFRENYLKDNPLCVVEIRSVEVDLKEQDSKKRKTFTEEDWKHIHVFKFLALIGTDKDGDPGLRMHKYSNGFFHPNIVCAAIANNVEDLINIKRDNDQVCYKDKIARVTVYFDDRNTPFECE